MMARSHHLDRDLANKILSFKHQNSEVDIKKENNFKAKAVS